MRTFSLLALLHKLFSSPSSKAIEKKKNQPIGNRANSQTFKPSESLIVLPSEIQQQLPKVDKNNSIVFVIEEKKGNSTPRNSRLENSEEKKGIQDFGKRTSRLMTFGFSSSKKLPPIEMTEDMCRLEKIVCDPKLTQLLIQKLLTIRGDFITKIRFISAVEKFDEIDDKNEQKLRAGKIIEMFFTEGSMFETSISEERKNLIVKEGKYSQFWEARKEVLRDLCGNDDILALIDMLLGVEAV